MHNNAEGNWYEETYSINPRGADCGKIVGPIGGKKIGIHPARVKKLMVSTNICGKKLAATDYKFHYTLEESFRDWFEDCGKTGLQ